jgi:hypothetical protein
MHLQLAGTPGRSYIIAATTNLSSPQWTALYTNTPAAGLLDYQDVVAGAFVNRFYRACVTQ